MSSSFWTFKKKDKILLLCDSLPATHWKSQNIESIGIPDFHERHRKPNPDSAAQAPVVDE